MFIVDLEGVAAQFPFGSKIWSKQVIFNQFIPKALNDSKINKEKLQSIPFKHF